MCHLRAKLKYTFLFEFTWIWFIICDNIHFQVNIFLYVIVEWLARLSGRVKTPSNRVIILYLNIQYTVKCNFSSFSSAGECSALMIWWTERLRRTCWWLVVVFSPWTFYYSATASPGSTIVTLYIFSLVEKRKIPLHYGLLRVCYCDLLLGSWRALSSPVCVEISDGVRRRASSLLCVLLDNILADLFLFCLSHDLPARLTWDLSAYA